MSTHQSTMSKTEDIQNTVRKTRNWLIAFVASAIVTIASVVAGSQSVISTGVMIVAAAMVVLHAVKYDSYFEPAAVRVEG